jgi:hypothetical protein
LIPFLPCLPVLPGITNSIQAKGTAVRKGIRIGMREVAGSARVVILCIRPAAKGAAARKVIRIITMGAAGNARWVITPTRRPEAIAAGKDFIIITMASVTRSHRALVRPQAPARRVQMHSPAVRSGSCARSGTGAGSGRDGHAFTALTVPGDFHK